LTKRQLTKQQRRRIEQNQANAGTEINTQQEATGGKTGDTDLERYGVVIASYGAQVDVEAIDISKKIVRRCHLRANLPTIVSGDKVTWKDSGTHGVVIAQYPRKSELCRPDNRGNLRPVAANIDRIAIVIAPYPEPHTNLIDRYLVAAEHQAIQPLIILNKADQIEQENLESLISLAKNYEKIGYDYFLVSAKDGVGMKEFEAYLRGLTSVFVGQSGVGKSSLLNRLSPEINVAVGGLSKSKEKGTHTTTTSRLFHLPSGGDVIDSPGIREFGLWYLKPDAIAEGFIEFLAYLGKCRFRNCRHQHEPDCALIEAISAGKIQRARFESYLHMVSSLKDG
jgi:ribosome biogenesis GTPase